MVTSLTGRLYNYKWGSLKVSACIVVLQDSFPHGNCDHVTSDVYVWVQLEPSTLLVTHIYCIICLHCQEIQYVRFSTNLVFGSPLTDWFVSPTTLTGTSVFTYCKGLVCSLINYWHNHVILLYWHMESPTASLQLYNKHNTKYNITVT